MMGCLAIGLWLECLISRKPLWACVSVRRRALWRDQNLAQIDTMPATRPVAV
jgi:hypothetical protein